MSLVVNKKARLEYEILDTYEAGLKLVGTEVKALRAGQGILEGARVLLRGGEAYLVGATIPPWQPGNPPPGYESDRTRKLLLGAGELRELIGRAESRGLTIIPLSVYNKGRHLKLSIAVVRRKKKHDKRETLKKRTAEREMERTLKTRQ